MGYKSDAQRKAVHASKAEQGASMKKFKVHMMYKDCKEVEAKTMGEHNKLKKKGYSHKKSKDCKNKKDGSSFNPKLKQPVGEAKLKGKFDDVVLGKN